MQLRSSHWAYRHFQTNEYSWYTLNESNVSYGVFLEPCLLPALFLLYCCNNLHLGNSKNSGRYKATNFQNGNLMVSWSFLHENVLVLFRFTVLSAILMMLSCYRAWAILLRTLIFVCFAKNPITNHLCELILLYCLFLWNVWLGSSQEIWK